MDRLKKVMNEIFEGSEYRDGGYTPDDYKSMMMILTGWYGSADDEVFERNEVAHAFELAKETVDKTKVKKIKGIKSAVEEYNGYYGEAEIYLDRTACEVYAWDTPTNPEDLVVVKKEGFKNIGNQTSEKEVKAILKKLLKE